MKEYWKVAEIRKLLIITSSETEDSTVTMRYLDQKKGQMRMMQQAYEDGHKDALQENHNE